MHPAVWAVFILFILAMLAIDLGVFNRTPHVMRFKEAMGWLGVWIGLAIGCGIFIWAAYTHHWFGAGIDPESVPGRAAEQLPVSGVDAAIQYFTGYLVEMSLSVDNIFVIAIVFQYFRVPGILQHRVLFWRIMGAIILRGVMIIAGAALLARFDWIVYVFGGFLILTAIKMALFKHEDIEPEKNLVLRVIRKFMPVHNSFVGQHFVVKLHGRLVATPLLVCLAIIETTDVVFAFDSIPAIFGITRDPFIVFTSNLFAILGLRTMYFGLAGLLARFHYLSKALILVLAFVGVKMCIHSWVEIPNMVSLGIVLGLLGCGVLVSLLVPAKGQAELVPQHDPGAGE